MILWIVEIYGFFGILSPFHIWVLLEIVLICIGKIVFLWVWVFFKNVITLYACLHESGAEPSKKKKKKSKSKYVFYLSDNCSNSKISTISSMHPFSTGKRRNLLSRLTHHQFLFMNFSRQGNTQRVKFNNTRMSKHIYLH